MPLPDSVRGNGACVHVACPSYLSKRKRKTAISSALNISHFFRKSNKMTQTQNFLDIITILFFFWSVCVCVSCVPVCFIHQRRRQGLKCGYADCEAQRAGVGLEKKKWASSHQLGNRIWRILEFENRIKMLNREMMFLLTDLMLLISFFGSHIRLNKLVLHCIVRKNTHKCGNETL